MKKNILKGVIIAICLGGIYYIRISSAPTNDLTQLAFENIEALALGESGNFRCYGDGDVDCHGYKVEKMYSGYSLE